MNMHAGTALMLIDFQRDFIHGAHLLPPAGVLAQRVRLLLALCRASGIPVIHVRTIVRGDKTNRMPHWKANKDNRCAEGTPGAAPPEGLEALPDEAVYEKTFYSAFGNPALNDHLRHAGIETLLIAGVHTHACIQATVLDAYQLGYAVKLVTDAIASYSPLHADLTVKHLTGRACESVTVAECFPDTPAVFPTGGKDVDNPVYPGTFINGQWENIAGRQMWEMRDPCRWDRRVGFVPIAGAREVERAVTKSCTAQPDWAARSSMERLNVLEAWATALSRLHNRCVELLIREVGKPRVEAEAEFAYALRLLRGTIQRKAFEKIEHEAEGVTVRYPPRGVVAIITPWNNPLALPVGKLAPALAYGNTAVWKPALQSPALVQELVGTLVDAGLPANCINVMLGDANTARALINCPEIAAVSFTGSEDAGREISTVCGLRGIPLQTELGGNNAALVAADVDVGQVARDLAQAAFSFSGQRCTAPRRLIVVEPIFDEFSQALIEAIGALKIGNPEDADTHLGPLISRDRQNLMRHWVAAALLAGAGLLTGGRVPAALAHGCWFEPTLLTGLPLDSPLVKEETFGPLAVLLKAEDFDHGIALCNDVRQGLRAICYARSTHFSNRFVQSAQAGVIHLNEAKTRISVDAPFLGWKSSSSGLPEHGRWDRDFYARTQAVYEKY